MKISTGTTRIVFIFDKFVVKIPNFLNGFKFILLGLTANINEQEWNNFNFKKLCPVIFTFPMGLFSIMAKAEHVGEFDLPSDKFFTGLPFDNNNNNWGIYKGRIVLIDYADNIEGFKCPECGNFWDEVMHDHYYRHKLK